MRVPLQEHIRHEAEASFCADSSRRAFRACACPCGKTCQAIRCNKRRSRQGAGAFAAAAGAGAGAAGAGAGGGGGAAAGAGAGAGGGGGSGFPFQKPSRSTCLALKPRRASRHKESPPLAELLVWIAGRRTVCATIRMSWRVYQQHCILGMVLVILVRLICLTLGFCWTWSQRRVPLGIFVFRDTLVYATSPARAAELSHFGFLVKMLATLRAPGDSLMFCILCRDFRRPAVASFMLCPCGAVTFMRCRDIGLRLAAEVNTLAWYIQARAFTNGCLDELGVLFVAIQ